VEDNQSVISCELRVNDAWSAVSGGLSKRYQLWVGGLYGRFSGSWGSMRSS